MKKAKKVLVLALTLAVLSFSLAGCGGGNDHPSNDHPASEHPAGEHPK